MKLIIDVDSTNHLGMMLWGEAKETLSTIEEAGKGDELIKLLEQIYCTQTPTLLDINEMLSEKREGVYKQLGI